MFQKSKGPKGHPVQFLSHFAFLCLPPKWSWSREPLEAAPRRHHTPASMWRCFVQLVSISQSFPDPFSPWSRERGSPRAGNTAAGSPRHGDRGSAVWPSLGVERALLTVLTGPFRPGFLLPLLQFLPPGGGPDRHWGEGVPGAEQLPRAVRKPPLLQRQGDRTQGPDPGRGRPRRPGPQDHGIPNPDLLGNLPCLGSPEAIARRAWGIGASSKRAGGSCCEICSPGQLQQDGLLSLLRRNPQ